MQKRTKNVGVMLKDRNAVTAFNVGVVVEDVLQSKHFVRRRTKNVGILLDGNAVKAFNVKDVATIL